MQTRHASTAPTVVGYNNTSTQGYESPAIGASFVPVNGSKTFKLKEIKPSGTKYGKDILQYLDPDTTVTLAQYTYFSQGEAEQMKIKQPDTDWDTYVGWWDLNKGGYKGGDEAWANEADIDVGQGFLGSMLNTVSFQTAGEAPTVPTSISSKGYESPMIASYIPRAFPLKWLVPDGSKYGKDILQYLDPNSTVTLAQYTYFSQAEADQMKIKQPDTDWDAYVGWWDLNKGGYKGGDEAKADAITVNPGDAFLGSMLNTVTFQFPSSTRSDD